MPFNLTSLRFGRLRARAESVPDAPTLRALGLALLELERAAEAVPRLQQAVELDPDSAEAHNALGLALWQLEQWAGARAPFARAVSLAPRWHAPLCNLANIHMSGFDQHDLALDLFMRAARLVARSWEETPDNPHLGLGLCALRGRGWRDALALLQGASDEPRDPAESYAAVALGLLHCGRYGEAEECFQELRARDVRETGFCLTGLGRVAQARRDLEGASRLYAEARLASPDDREILRSYLKALVVLGRYEAVRPYYARVAGFLGGDGFHAPSWTGQPLAGKTLMLHATSGYGDSIQTVRFVQRLREAGTSIHLRCQRKLVGLMDRAVGVDRAFGYEDDCPEADYEQLLDALPGLTHVSPDNVAQGVPYFDLPAALREEWAARLRGAPGLRVGVVWQGSPLFHLDPYRRRSVPRELMWRLADVAGVTLFSLQVETEAEALRASQARVVDLSGHVQGFLPTAGAVAALDLIVSIDTSIAHLAGALGRPTWVLLPYSPTARWGLGADHSVWYPTMRLFRQAEPGSWAAPVENVVAQLRRHAAAAAPRGRARQARQVKAP